MGLHSYSVRRDMSLLIRLGGCVRLRPLIRQHESQLQASPFFWPSQTGYNSELSHHDWRCCEL